MILVADGGSTKTEWIIINQGTAGGSFFSTGINPYFLTTDEIRLLLAREIKEISGLPVSQIFFYGTGCNSEAKKESVRGALQSIFPAEQIFIGTDLLGAARSLCQNNEGIACIMGTGSNSCYYNGSVIVSNVSPLGYILGDEGGGAVLGRKLISAVLKRQVPDHIIDLFFETYKITPAEIQENVYIKPFPNRFLGQFARFFSANINIPELKEIVSDSFNEFIKRNILQYPESSRLNIHFTGSIAFHFSQILTDLLVTSGLNPGKITLSPMQGLISYHITN